MTTPVLPADIPANVARAAEVLRNGGLLALPTDTVYGLAAALDQPQALRRIYAVKGREVEKALPVLMSNAGELSRIAAQVSPAVQTLSRHFWPGPLTLVVPKRAGLSPAPLPIG